MRVMFNILVCILRSLRSVSGYEFAVACLMWRTCCCCFRCCLCFVIVLCVVVSFGVVLSIVSYCLLACIIVFCCAVMSVAISALSVVLISAPCYCFGYWLCSRCSIVLVFLRLGVVNLIGIALLGALVVLSSLPVLSVSALVSSFFFFLFSSWLSLWLALSALFGRKPSCNMSTCFSPET